MDGLGGTSELDADWEVHRLGCRQSFLWRREWWFLDDVGSVGEADESDGESRGDGEELHGILVDVAGGGGSEALDRGT